MNTHSTPRRILNAIHSSTLSQLIPLGVALCAYVLYLLAGADEQKLVLAIATPVVCLIVYFLFSGMVLRILQNPRYVGKADPDLLFLLMTVVFTLAALALLMQFLTNVQYGFTAALPVSLVIWSAVSRVCHKRAAK